MRFIPVDEKKKAETLAFLSKYERFCVSLVEHIRRDESDIFSIEGDARETLGVISVKSRMLLCVPNARSLQNDKAFCSSLKVFLSDKKISCVNGEAEASHFIMKILAACGGTGRAANMRYACGVRCGKSDFGKCGGNR